MTTKLGDLTSLGPLELKVANLQGQSEFYQQQLGLRLRSQSADAVSLGTEKNELLRLALVPGAKRSRHTAGLYHFCLRVDERVELGLLLKHLFETKIHLDGLVDHRMAEAIYLKDAEGNGIELNWDRPRSEWRPWEEWLSMGNAPLDVEGLLDLADSSGRDFKQISPSARVGHIHLHVGNLEEAEKFYTQVAGFEVTTKIPGQATFTSAGGYHHHVAFNLWAGRDIQPAPADALGLKEFTVLVDGPSEIEALKKRAQAAAWAYEEDGKNILIKDPWNHLLRFVP